MNPVLTKSFLAQAAITKYRIVKPGSADGQVLQAAAVGDAMIGVANEIDAAIGERIDVVLVGIADVEYGGTIARGDLLTSDANGKAVAAAPAAGTNNRIVGVALVAGVSGDIGSCVVSQSRPQG
ncbi:MAG: capsid cement protein [Gammaproteobacteria bacterium]